MPASSAWVVSMAESITAISTLSPLASVCACGRRSLASVLRWIAGADRCRRLLAAQLRLLLQQIEEVRQRGQNDAFGLQRANDRGHPALIEIFEARQGDAIGSKDSMWVRLSFLASAAMVAAAVLPPADQHLVRHIAVLIRGQLPAAGATSNCGPVPPPPPLVELRIDDAERRRGGDGGDRRRADDDHGMLGPARQPGGLLSPLFLSPPLTRPPLPPRYCRSSLCRRYCPG